MNWWVYYTIQISIFLTFKNMVYRERYSTYPYFSCRANTINSHLYKIKFIQQDYNMSRQIHLAIWMLRVSSMYIQFITLRNSVYFQNYFFSAPLP